METAHKLAECQKKSGWPANIDSTTAKNHKVRVKEMSKVLSGTLHVGASVQSTDEEVLKNIKRDNISLDQLMNVASDRVEDKSFAEIILCLPGDTKEKHLATAFQILNLGTKEIRVYQFYLLTGTESGSKASREKYRYSTCFRLTPRCFGRYEAYGEPFEVFEFRELCVGNSSMSYEDYLQCRDLTLIIGIFNNGGVFFELLMALKRAGISCGDFFRQLWDVYQKGEMLPDLFQEFREIEAKDFWRTEEELRDFLAQPGTFEKYESGEYGVHHLFYMQSIALGGYFENIVNIAFDAAHSLIQKNGGYGESEELFLDELKQYLLLVKGNLLSMDDPGLHKFHFDFIKIKKTEFTSDPNEFFSLEGLNFSFVHQKKHTKAFDELHKQFGEDSEGLARMIRRMPGGLAALSREAVYAEDAEPV